MSEKAAEAYDAIVIGGGAAGMMCALTAGQRGRKVLLIDHCPELGKKILISGGGRCNFTNLHTAPERYLSNNPHFAKSALQRYRPEHFIAMVDRHGIAWHEKTLGQLFCDGSAKQIVSMLCEECRMGGVSVRLGQRVREVTRDGEMYRVSCGDEPATAPALVIATGGPSIPKMGATGFAYELAGKFGLDVVEPRPALVPLTLSGDDADFMALPGVSTEVVACCNGVAFREAALFTHRGLSGPAILQISSYWRPGDDVAIDFVPSAEPTWLVEAKRKHSRLTLRSVLAQTLPARLAEVLDARLDVRGELANCADKVLEDARKRLSDWRFRPNGTEGFAKAEVTAGGISTDELSSRTMQAKRVPGLYVIGEAVDVTGWLGGYNFQWAWASGWAAGQAL